MNTEAMIKNKELTEYLKDNLKQKEDIEDEMLDLGDRLTDLMLERERLEMERSGKIGRIQLPDL